jgi:hypothetical protein
MNLAHTHSSLCVYALVEAVDEVNFIFVEEALRPKKPTKRYLIVMIVHAHHLIISLLSHKYYLIQHFNYIHYIVVVLINKVK